ncbi:Sodium- and chloride-dependent GABA transporter 3 [Anabarilius grahami]|uniref:Transporter n=1 Tax=Anabarilius grahami TaxID=495550 RepID=A0A3N0XQS6_ANAGA|nr:Sodium- and chloride-dependent GABA transporter 3 [Anabarilius grahami]
MERLDGQIEERGHWGSKAEFLLAVAGNVIGLGNVWRFPYLCYKYGGGAFLIPYMVFVVTCGMPLFLLETAMGQYTQEGGITCWHRLCPLVEGIGYAGQLILLYSCMYYIIILAWALLYLFFSFSSQLPWASCDNTWNTDDCVNLAAKNLTINRTSLLNSTPAATEFWEKRVLVLSGGIEEVGKINWEILLCLIAMWIICYFCIWKGVKSTGKVVYFTATFPYVMLLVLLIRGLTLPGALQGVMFYLYPEPARLTDPQFAAMEAVITSVMDLFPAVLRKAGRREILLLVFCLTCFFGQLIMVTELSFICSMVEYQPLTFNRWYVYPDWAYALGWLLALSSILLVPAWALGRMCAEKGSMKQRWHRLCSPDTELPFTSKQLAEMKETAFTAEMEVLVRTNIEEHQNGL